MSARTAQHRSPGVLAVLLMLQLILMSTTARHPHSEQSILSNWIMALLTPAVTVVDKVISGVAGAARNISELSAARGENVRLREQVEQLTGERDRANERAAELDLLRNQLGVPTVRNYTELAANVVSRPASVWFRHIVIDRGSLDGVKLSMPVTTVTGIVGRVIEVGPNYSRVQLITDKHAGVGAMLQGSRTMGESHGVDNNGGRCELKNISGSSEVGIGEVVVTTGLDGIYPKGLVVGNVEQVESDPNGPWHKITVKPAAPVDRLEHVFVLLIEQQDLKMSETIK